MARTARRRTRRGLAATAFAGLSAPLIAQLTPTPASAAIPAPISVDLHINMSSGLPYNGQLDIACADSPTDTGVPVINGNVTWLLPPSTSCKFSPSASNPLHGDPAVAMTLITPVSSGAFDVTIPTAIVIGSVVQLPLGSGTVDPDITVQVHSGTQTFDAVVSGSSWTADVTSNLLIDSVTYNGNAATAPQYALTATPVQMAASINAGRIDPRGPTRGPTVEAQVGTLDLNARYASGVVRANQPVSISYADGTAPVLNAHGAAIPATSTDSLGDFVFTDLLPGNYVVQVGDVSAPYTLGSGDVAHDVLAAGVQTGALQVSVVDSAGNPIPGAAVSVDTFNGSTDSTGVWASTGIPVGDYTVQVTAPAPYTAGAQNVTVAADATTTVTVTLAAIGTPPGPSPEPQPPVPTPQPIGESMRMNTALPVTRLADTRTSGSMVTPASPLRIHVADRAAAAVLQITADQAAAPGYLTAYPCTPDVPLASNVNYVAGQASSALSTVMIAASGDVCIAAMNPVHVIVDRMAVYEPATTSASGRFVPIAPQRLVDTRATGDPFVSGEERTISLGIAPGASAVSINLTAITGTPGWLAAYPAGAAYSGTSNLNVGGNRIGTSAVIVPVSADGKITVKVQNAGDVIVDINGYFTGASDQLSSAGLFVPTMPTRVLDTRATGHTGSRFAAGETRAVSTGVPSNANAVAATVTYISTAPGYITVWDHGSLPLASNINAATNAIVPNMVSVAVSSGAFQVFSQSGGDLVVDIAGYFLSAA